jgi:type II secretory pathway pseudopilin PulG
MKSRTPVDRMRSQRGITLVEVTVVGVLAAIVMLALTGFYVNSQGTWIDSSAQAVTQREASFVLETLTDSIHTASSATVSSGPPMLVLYNAGGIERSRFWLGADDRIHVGGGNPSVDQGPLETSRATLFVVGKNDSMVYVTALQLHTASTDSVTMSTAAAMLNRIPPP